MQSSTDEQATPVSPEAMERNKRFLKAMDNSQVKNYLVRLYSRGLLVPCIIMYCFTGCITKASHAGRGVLGKWLFVYNNVLLHWLYYNSCWEGRAWQVFWLNTLKYFVCIQDVIIFT